MDALAELGIFFRKELRPRAAIGRLPSGPGVFASENPDGGDADEHAPRIQGIDDNGMEAKASRAGMPLGARRMRGQRDDFAPCLAVIVAAKQRGRGDSGVKNIWLPRRAGFEMPDAVQFHSRTLGKFWVLSRRLPMFTQIGRGNDFAAEPGVVGGGKDAAIAGIVDGVMDLPALLKRAANGPAPAVGAGQKEQALFRAEHH